MRKLLLPLAAVALLGLSACGQRARNEANEAGESIGGDSNTMGEAVADVNAAFNAAEASYAGNAADIPDGNEIVE